MCPWQAFLYAAGGAAFSELIKWTLLKNISPAAQKRFLANKNLLYIVGLTAAVVVGGLVGLVHYYNGPLTIFAAINLGVTGPAASHVLGKAYEVAS